MTAAADEDFLSVWTIWKSRVIKVSLCMRKIYDSLLLWIFKSNSLQDHSELKAAYCFVCMCSYICVRFLKPSFII